MSDEIDFYNENGDIALSITAHSTNKTKPSTSSSGPQNRFNNQGESIPFLESMQSCSTPTLDTPFNYYDNDNNSNRRGDDYSDNAECTSSLSLAATTPIAPTSPSINKTNSEFNSVDVSAPNLEKIDLENENCEGNVYNVIDVNSSHFDITFHDTIDGDLQNKIIDYCDNHNRDSSNDRNVNFHNIESDQTIDETNPHYHHRQMRPQVRDFEFRRLSKTLSVNSFYCNTPTEESKQQTGMGWVYFILAFLFVACLNVPFLILTFELQKENTLYDSLSLFIDEYNEIKRNITDWEASNSTTSGGNVTSSINITEVLLHKQELDGLMQIIRHQADTSFLYCLISGLVHLGFILAIGIITFFYRKSVAFRSRGSHFLTHLFIAAICTIVVVILTSANGLLQYPATNPLVTGETERYITMSFSLAALALFFVIGLYTAIMTRIRLIHIAFSQTPTLHTKKSYLIFIPLQFVLFTLSMSTIILGFFMKSKHKFLDCFGLFLSTFFFLLWVLWYTWKCRHYAVQFSDFYINCRVVSVTFIFITAACLIEILRDTFLDGIVFQYAIQAFILVNFFDQFLSMALFHINNRQLDQFSGHESHNRSLDVYGKNSHRPPREIHALNNDNNNRNADLNNKDNGDLNNQQNILQNHETRKKKQNDNAFNIDDDNDIDNELDNYSLKNTKIGKKHTDKAPKKKDVVFENCPANDDPEYNPSTLMPKNSKESQNRILNITSSSESNFAFNVIDRKAKEKQKLCLSP